MHSMWQIALTNTLGAAILVAFHTNMCQHFSIFILKAKLFIEKKFILHLYISVYVNTLFV